jgi:phosphonate transport system substrate-binding protein
VVIGYILPEDNPAAQSAIETLTGELIARTGYSIAAAIYPNYNELLTGFRSGSVQAAWLLPLTYLFLNSRGYVEVRLLTNHFGTYYYGTQILANIESGLTSYFDPRTNTNTTEAEIALSQLDGLRPCWVDEGSLSGFIYPYGLLRQMDIELLPGAFVQSHTAVVRSLYIKGVCDFGATFSESGDPRTASAVVADLPDVAERVIVLWQSDADIPGLNFSISPELSEEIRKSLTQTLIELVNTETGKLILTDATGGYDIQDLRVVDDSIYDPLRVLLHYTGVEPGAWLGR